MREGGQEDEIIDVVACRSVAVDLQDDVADLNIDAAVLVDDDVESENKS